MSPHEILQHAASKFVPSIVLKAPGSVLDQVAPNTSNALDLAKWFHNYITKLAGRIDLREGDISEFEIINLDSMLNNFWFNEFSITKAAYEEGLFRQGRSEGHTLSAWEKVGDIPSDMWDILALGRDGKFPPFTRLISVCTFKYR